MQKRYLNRILLLILFAFILIIIKQYYTKKDYLKAVGDLRYNTTFWYITGYSYQGLDILKSKKLNVKDLIKLSADIDSVSDMCNNNLKSLKNLLSKMSANCAILVNNIQNNNYNETEREKIKMQYQFKMLTKLNIIIRDYVLADGITLKPYSYPDNLYSYIENDKRFNKMLDEYYNKVENYN